MDLQSISQKAGILIDTACFLKRISKELISYYIYLVNNVETTYALQF